MDRGNRHSLISMLNRMSLRKKRNTRNMTCPNCNGNHVELLNQIVDEEGSWRRELYLCCDCDSEWDWTYKRPFFRWKVKIRSPKWVRID